MKTVEECKKILLSAGEDFSDEEILLLRELLYNNAKIGVEEYLLKLNTDEEERV